MDFYWEIIRRNEPTVFIPPDKVESVRKRWDEGKPIHTSTGSIPHHQIVDFRISNRRFSQQVLIGEAPQPFGAPVITDDGEMKAKWVKKPVSASMYQKHYGAIPAYRKLSDEGGMVWVAFKLPVHLINNSETDLCTPEDIKRLTETY